MHASFDRWWNGISLRTKITGVTVLLLTFGLAVAGIGTANVLRSYLLEQVDAKVKTSTLAVAQQRTPTQILNCDLDYTTNDLLLVVLDSSGDVECDNVPAGAADPDTSDVDVEWTQDHKGLPETIADAAGKVSWRISAQAGPLDATGEVYSMVVGIPLRDTDSTVARFSIIFFGFALAVIVLGAAMTQLLVTSTFAPLRDVERTAARFAAGDYSQRLGGATPNTEVGRLNRSLNTMLARIDSAFSDRARTIDQMRRFVGDASHELRTPLVSLRGYAELYRMGAIQKPEDVAQAMDRIEREAIRMGGLVQDLLELARLDEAKQPDLKPVDLLPIAQDVALDTSASNASRTISVVVPEPTGADTSTLTVAFSQPTIVTPGTTVETAAAANANSSTVTGRIALAGATLARLRRPRRGRDGATESVEDSLVVPAVERRALPDVGPIVLAEGDKIRQVITNLVGNAIRYTADDSPIELVVEVDRVGGFGSISVVDHGEGIPPQLREKIFQRFYRADTSRTRETGGSGLGLAIVAGIVQNHNGHVEVLETPGGGATFRVSLPLLPHDAVDPNSTDASPAAEGTARRS